MTPYSCIGLVVTCVTASDAVVPSVFFTLCMGLLRGSGTAKLASVLFALGVSKHGLLYMVSMMPLGSCAVVRLCWRAKVARLFGPELASASAGIQG